jgi:hypothetical protein
MKITQHRGTFLTPPKWTVALGFACLTAACVTAYQCGSWDFSGTPEWTPGVEYSDQFPLTSSFTFTPASCASNCNVQIDAMVQITWVYDATTAPTSMQTRKIWIPRMPMVGTSIS